MIKARKGVKPLGYMDERGYEYAVVDIDLLIPNTSNPRIPVKSSLLETVIALLEDDADGLFNLAKDIVELQGTDPGQLLNVSPLDDSFVVMEGNRRTAVRKLLRNPEMLRGQVSDQELTRWQKLSRQDNAKTLPSALLVAVGEDHEDWVDRRHLGHQEGVGTYDWKAEARARRAERQTGTMDRTLALIDGLRETFGDRFDGLQPPQRTFTTLGRLVESQVARAHIGIDVTADRKVRLTKGEKSVRLLAEILGDLRKQGKEKLTSRTVHGRDEIERYLGKLDVRIGEVDAEGTVTLGEKGKSKSRRRARSKRKHSDAHLGLEVPTHPRLRKLFNELLRAHKNDSPNAAMILTRVLLELAADRYAAVHKLTFAGDENVVVAQQVKEFMEAIGRAQVTYPNSIREGLRAISRTRVSAGEKLALVIDDLADEQQYVRKEADAKKRELKHKDIVAVLNDAVHRLDNEPSMERVEHVLAVLLPIYNLMIEH